MTQRKPGDYVVNVELKDEQRERFVRDCVAAGADRHADAKKNYATMYYFSEMLNAVGSELRKGVEIAGGNNVTSEYQTDRKAQPTTQPQLMRQIADAMERNPEGWFREFEYFDEDEGRWVGFEFSEDVWAEVGNRAEIRPKPRTYTLHVEGMPEPLREEPESGDIYYFVNTELSDPEKCYWSPAVYHRPRLLRGLCYPDEPTAREALEKLTKAMRGGND